MAKGGQETRLGLEALVVVRVGALLERDLGSFFEVLGAVHSTHRAG
jgi:hypothetical protein